MPHLYDLFLQSPLVSLNPKLLAVQEVLAFESRVFRFYFRLLVHCISTRFFSDNSKFDGTWGGEGGGEVTFVPFLSYVHRNSTMTQIETAAEDSICYLPPPFVGVFSNSCVRTRTSAGSSTVTEEPAATPLFPGTVCWGWTGERTSPA